MNIKRNIILAFLGHLKKQLDEDFSQVRRIELTTLVEQGFGPPICHLPSFGKVIVEPGGRIYVSVHPTISVQVSGYMLEKQQFLGFLEAVKKRVSAQPVELELKTEEIVNNYFVDECRRNHVFLNQA